MLQSNYLKKCSETCSLITPTVVTCNSTLRNVRKHVCPNPEIIKQHLFKTTGFEGSIPQDGRVCPACYIQCPFDITPTVVTCNSTLRNVRKHVCPNPEIIQQHLFKTTGFEGSIPQDGRVCPACYIQCPFDYH